MPTQDDSVATAAVHEAALELGEALARIRHCLDQLDDQQVWWRQSPSHNAIGNLILHLCGNMGQWMVSGLGGAPDVRRRPEEFTQRAPIAKAELLARLEAVVKQSQAVLAALSSAELLRIRRIQGYDVTGMGAIFHTVPHFRGHTQEIIHMTRALLGDRYRFAWKPAGPEQGAPP